MRTFKALLKLFLLIILKIILSPFWAIVWALKVVETTMRIVKETITFFIEQIESEVLK